MVPALAVAAMVALVVLLLAFTRAERATALQPWRVTHAGVVTTIKTYARGVTTKLGGSLSFAPLPPSTRTTAAPSYPFDRPVMYLQGAGKDISGAKAPGVFFAVAPPLSPSSTTLVAVTPLNNNRGTLGANTRPWLKRYYVSAAALSDFARRGCLSAYVLRAPYGVDEAIAAMYQPAV